LLFPSGFLPILSFDSSEGGPFTGPFQWSHNVYYINIDYTGYPIYPGGRIPSERQCNFTITGPSDPAFDPLNDWSFHGLSGSCFTYEPVDLTGYTEYIPVYDSGILLKGKEPPSVPTEEPTPDVTPVPVPTKKPKPTPRPK
jgi:endoglucanase